eukprot:6491428-Amphidinium_carterae.2
MPAARIPACAYMRSGAARHVHSHVIFTSAIFTVKGPHVAALGMASAPLRGLPLERRKVAKVVSELIK